MITSIVGIWAATRAVPFFFTLSNDNLTIVGETQDDFASPFIEFDLGNSNGVLFGVVPGQFTFLLASGNDALVGGPTQTLAFELGVV